MLRDGAAAAQIGCSVDPREILHSCSKSNQTFGHVLALRLSNT